MGVADPLSACSDLKDPESVNGKIVIVDGKHFAISLFFFEHDIDEICELYVKARILQKANATGMIVVSWSAFLGKNLRNFDEKSQKNSKLERILIKL